MQAFPWPLAWACLAHVLAGVLLLLSVEAFMVLLMAGTAHLPARMAAALALLVAALRHVAVIGAMTLSVLAPLAVLHVYRFTGGDMKASWATTLLLLDYALIFTLVYWLRKKI